eukprot:1147014-Pelagomonas_calceolata.AAC.2
MLRQVQMHVPRQPDGFAHSHCVVKRQSKECLVRCQLVICFSRVYSLNISPYTTQSVPQIISKILQGKEKKNYASSEDTPHINKGKGYA